VEECRFLRYFLCPIKQPLISGFFMPVILGEFDFVSHTLRCVFIETRDFNAGVDHNKVVVRLVEGFFG